MSKLRHIAIIVEDPEASAKFFEEAFDMKRAGTARRGIYMSDGIFNVALLKNKAFAAQIRNYTAMRRRVHLTRDNSAKT